jgi:succinyl-diaminopimelate desuccinylase
MKILQNITKLVAFETTENNLTEQLNCFGYIKKMFSFYPFVVREYMISGIPSMVLSVSKGKHFKIMLVAHIDVVSANKSLFKIRKKGDKLFGRGISDMKFAIATYAFVLKEMYSKYHKLPSVGLMFTADEEIAGNCGPGYLLNAKNFSCDITFLPDGGDNWHVIKESRGILQVKLIIRGKSVHGSTPWKGESAILKLFKIGEKLHKMFPSTSEEDKVVMNFGKIEGGKALNQVCDEASLYLDFRLAAKKPPEVIVADLKAAFKEVEIEVIDNFPSFMVDAQDTYIKHWKNLLYKKGKKKIFINESGATDAPYFSEKKIPVIVSKPMGGGIHSDNEWISLSSVMEFAAVLEEFLSKYI